jgi:hypothetical protein
MEINKRINLIIIKKSAPPDFPPSPLPLIQKCNNSFRLSALFTAPQSLLPELALRFQLIIYKVKTISHEQLMGINNSLFMEIFIHWTVSLSRLLVLIFGVKYLIHYQCPKSGFCVAPGSPLTHKRHRRCFTSKCHYGAFN